MENVPHSGVIIGRWYDNANLDDMSYAGNAYFNNSSIPHTYWVFRPNSSNDITNGNINNAAFGYDNRTSFGPTTNPHPYLTDGTPEQSFEITNIQEHDSTLTFHVHFLPVGIPDNRDENATICVYPNPASNILFVRLPQCDNPTTEQTEYRIINLMGQTILQGSISTENQQIDIASLPAGMYFFSVDGETVKFVVK